jgi:hypothetical protein
MVLREAHETTKRKRVQKEVPPFEELRHDFIVGRPTEVDHTPLSAVNAAQAELIRLELAIKTRGLTCAAQVGLVVGSKDRQPFGGKLFVVSHSLDEIATMITAISQLKEPTLAGLVYCVLDAQTGAYEFWTKAFVKSRDAEKILDLAVADGLRRLQGKPVNYSA